MATLRLTLYAGDFSTLDSTDLPVTGSPHAGAGAAVRTARDHFWENHVKDDLDTLLASRKALMDAGDELLKVMSTAPFGFVNKGVYETFKGALQEARMVDELNLPKTVREDLEKKLAR